MLDLTIAFVFWLLNLLNKMIKKDHGNDGASRKTAAISFLLIIVGSSIELSS